MNDRVLTKLNIGSPNLTPGVAASKNTNLRREDVAAILGMGRLSAGAYWFALAYYMADKKAFYNLELKLWDMLTTIAIEKNWKVKPGTVGPDKKTRNRILCQIAMEEVFNPKRCPKCHGRGWIKYEDDACEECDRVGTVGLSSRQYARRLDIDQKNWLRTWATRYWYAKQNLITLIDELAVHVEEFKGN